MPVLLVLAAGINTGWAQSASADSADKTAPSYDMKAQSLVDLGASAEKIC